jgi:DMSO reductase anchor subunit
MIDFLKNIKFMDVLALIVVLLCFAYFFIKGFDNGLIAVVATVISYYFGSSITDKNKPSTPE